MGGTLIVKSALQMQATKSAEGFTRTIAILPTKLKVLYLGVDPVDSSVSIWGTVAGRPRDAEGNFKPFEPHELGHVEFITVLAGQDVPDTYQFRATVPTAQGLLFLFEKKQSSLLIPGGRG